MAGSGSGDGLVRWLVGGLVAGGIVLGLLVGAYEIGYHRGRPTARVTAPVATTSQPPTTTTSTAPTTTTASSGAAGVARGEQLFTADGCASCHSLDGTTSVGPTMQGLAGSTVTLSDGSTATADDAYLTRSITDPDAEIAKGFQPGIMPPAISSFGLTGKPQDVAALVAFIKSKG